MKERRRVLLTAMVAAFLVAAAASGGCGAVRELSGVLGEAQTSSGAYPGEIPAPATADRSVPEKGVAGGSPEVAATAAPLEARLIVRTKTMRVEVKDVRDAVGRIRAIAAKHGGSITALSVASDTDEPVYRPEAGVYGSVSDALRGYVTVRIPVEKFEPFVTEAASIGTVKHESESSDDVTQQHVDLKARLDNLRAEERRLRTFFDSAKNVDEMLAVERELARVRQEIESMDAQVQYLERQAAMATVTIELTEPKPVVRPAGESWGFLDAVTTGFRGAAAVVKIIIVLAITVVPLIVLGTAAYLAIRTVVRRRRAKKATPAQE